MLTAANDVQHQAISAPRDASTHIFGMITETQRHRMNRLQLLSGSVLQVGLALMALVSLQPYLLWVHQKPAYGVATMIIMVSCAGYARAMQFTRERVILSVAFSIFLIYLSLLPKVHGGFTRWFFLIPFTVALIHLSREDLRRVFGLFHWIFALSLVPGMLLWLWILAGLPMELRFLTPTDDIVQRGVTEYLELPGAVFLLSNAIVLPHGGTLFRLCGMYDEPGTVGTIAALCLAATRFRLGDGKGAITWAAGIMSLSVAFAVLTSIGFAVMAFRTRRRMLLAGFLTSVLVGLIPLSGFKFADAPASNITILTFAPRQTGGEEQVARRERFAPFETWRLRNSSGFDNRAQPWMRQLFNEYAAAPVTTKLFGIASDASTTLGWGSSVWYRILTDFGIVGFAWVFILFSFPPLYLWRERLLEFTTVIFCTLFLMSFYQRPIIWLPAQLLIYIGGVWMRQEIVVSRGGSRNAQSP